MGYGGGRGRKRELLGGSEREMYFHILRKTERIEICVHVEIINKGMNKQ